MKTISELETDAIHLEALCQGAIELFDGVTHSATPASNALYALLHVLEEKAGQLASELDRIDCETPKIVRTIVDPVAQES